MTKSNRNAAKHLDSRLSAIAQSRGLPSESPASLVELVDEALGYVAGGDVDNKLGPGDEGDTWS